MRTAAQVDAVFRRLRRLRTNPPLFNDRITPKSVRRRLERLRRWCGPALWQSLCTAEVKREPLKESSMQYRTRRPAGNGNT